MQNNQPYWVLVDPQIARDVRRLRAQTNPLRVIGLLLLISTVTGLGLAGVTGLAMVCKYMGW